MSNTFTLVDETEQHPQSQKPVAAWSPATSKALGSGDGNGGSSSKASKPSKAKPSKQSKPKKSKKYFDENGVELPYKPLEATKAKKISRGEQKKRDKATAAKIKAADAAALRLLGSDDNAPLPKKPFFELFDGKRARPDEVAETLTDLASMLETGDSEVGSVAALAEQYADYDIGQAYERVVLLLNRGVTLTQALADQTDTFPPVVRELIGAANMPKDLHRNLRQAAIIIVEADNIKSQVKNALFKPGFLLLLLAVFTVVAVQFLLPMTADMFTGIGAEAPETTQIVMGIGGWLQWVAAGSVVAAMLWVLCWKLFLRKNDRFVTIIDRKTLKAPLIGDIMRMAVAARFSDVLAACLSVGMSEMDSLATAGRACGNKALQAWVQEHVQRQSFGVVTFSDVAKTELLPWNFRNRMETTASLTRRIELLEELGKTFHDKAQDRLGRFAERIGPISEGVVLGVIVVVVLLIVSPVLTFIPTLIGTVG